MQAFTTVSQNYFNIFLHYYNVMRKYLSEEEKTARPSDKTFDLVVELRNVHRRTSEMSIVELRNVHFLSETT